MLLILVVWYGVHPDLKTYCSDNQGPVLLVDLPHSPVKNIELPSRKPFDRVIIPSLDKLRKHWELPGVSFACSYQGRLLYTYTTGFGNRTEGLPVDTSSLFRIASVSKLITAIAVMKLVEMGKLSITEPVFGPRGVIRDTTYWHARDQQIYDITVEHLLRHQGGWTTYWGDPMFMPDVIRRHLDLDHPPDRDEIIGWALSRKLHFTPGTATAYSNLGYAILGKVIEEASGMTYEKFVQSFIFFPLGIRDIRPGKNEPGRSWEHEVAYYSEADTLVSAFYDHEQQVPLPYGQNDVETLGAAGEWVASAPALCRLVAGIDGDPEVPDILSKKSIRFLEGKPGIKFPVGWRYRERDGDLVRTGSFAGTFAMIRKSSDGLVWVFLTNTRPWVGSDFSRRVEWPLRKADENFLKVISGFRIHSVNP